MKVTSSNYTLLLPGQTAFNVESLQEVSKHDLFREHYEDVCDRIDSDPLKEIDQGNTDSLNLNLQNSLLTSLVSYVNYEIFKTRPVFTAPGFVAGYSVGQWMALCLSGSLPFPLLLEVLCKRAHYMNEAVRGKTTGMLSVIGLKEDVVKEVCLEIEENESEMVVIANYNCLGQYTLAGSISGIASAREKCSGMNPIKIVDLPMSGAWHSIFMKPAVAPFRNYLASVDLKPPKFLVACNGTGKELPSEREKLLDALAEHLCKPVLWEKCIKHLISLGSRSFIELSRVPTLSKFGFFIDRSLPHQTAF